VKKIFKYSIFSIIPLILLILSSAVSLGGANRIFKENSKAVVVITAYDEKGNAISRGSGFIVKRDGAVVTNYHVINMAKDIKIKAGDKIFDVEGLIFTDKENDLVILKAKARDMPVVKLGVIGKEDIGENVYVIGNPSGLENTISVGLLSRIRKIDEKREILKMTVPASPGSSGSPVFKRNGEVIGVVTSSSISGIRNSCYAISVKLIKDKISSKNVTAIKESGLEDLAMYWFYLGGAYGKSDRYEEAIEAYKQAIRIDPDYADAHLNLGAVYKKSGMYKEAMEAYKQAIRIDPDYANIHNGLGVAYDESGMYKEAMEAYKQALRIDPDYANAYYNLGVAYAKSGMYKEGREACKQAIRIDPAFAEAHYNLGATYVFLNDRDSALEQYKILKCLDSGLAKVMLKLIN